jgi:AsmA protein
MRPIYRWLLLALAALIVLPLAAVLCVMLWVDPNRFRAPIENAARERLGLPLQLQGDLAWQWWPLLSMSASGGRINDPVGGNPLLLWQKLEFGARWPALMRQRLEVDALRIDGLQLRLQRDAQGRGNWQSLAEQVGARLDARGAAAAPGTGPDSGQASFTLASLQLRDASIHLDDAGTGRQWRADGLQFQAALGYAPGSGTLQLDAPRLRATLAAGDAAGRSWELDFESPQLRLDTRTPSLDAANWRLQLAGLQLDGTQLEPLRFEPLSGAGQLKFSTASIRELLQRLGVQPPPTRDSDALGKLDGELGWTLKAGRLDLQPLQLKGDDTTFTGLAMWPLDDTGPALLELHGDHADFDRYRRPEDQPGEPFELPVEKLRAIDLEGEVSFETATLFGVTLRGAKFHLYSDRGVAAASRR